MINRGEALCKVESKRGAENKNDEEILQFCHFFITLHPNKYNKVWAMHCTLE
jgi:hypothetical protein